MTDEEFKSFQDLGRKNSALALAAGILLGLVNRLRQGDVPGDLGKTLNIAEELIVKACYPQWEPKPVKSE